MKFVYIRQIIIILGVLVLICGPYMCFSKAYDNELNIHSKKIDEIARYDGNIPDSIQNKLDRESKANNIIRYGGTILFIGIGIIIIKKADNLINFITKSDNKIKERSKKNKYEDLEKLQKLKEDGIITEVEFEIEKTKLLR